MSSRNSWGTFVFVGFLATLAGRSVAQGVNPRDSRAVAIAGAHADVSGSVHISTSNGRETVPPREKAQVGVGVLKISQDRLAVGWLVNFDNCCTSYPIALTLVIYRYGQPLERLGNGMMICDWRFLEGGKEVAFASNTVHGDLAPHYELHDVATAKLLAKWDGHWDARAPKWAAGFAQ